MAFLILTRLGLLLLLGCDYFWDPYYGNNPLSHELASTETYCQSLNASAAAMDSVDPVYGRTHQGDAWAQGESPIVWHTPVGGSIPHAAIHDLLYLFMSLQR